MSLTTDENAAVTLGKDRLAVCLAASWELDTLAELLTTVTNNETPEALKVGYRVRAIASRIKELASIQMAGLDDDMEKTDDLRSRLNVYP